MKLLRRIDLMIPRTGRTAPPDPALMLGRWVNTNWSTTGMAEITIATGPQGHTLHVLGVGEDGPIDWGTMPLELFFNVEEEDSRPSVAALATHDFGFMAIDLQIRLNRGVLVVAQFTEFKDDSGRSSYFGREFFYRAAGG